MNKDRSTNSDTLPANGQEALRPWYREPWPWVLIALPGLTVIACAFTIYLAITNPDHLVIKDDDYKRVKSELRAGSESSEAGQTDSEGDG